LAFSAAPACPLRAPDYAPFSSNPLRLILAEQLGGRSTPRLIFKIDICQLLPVAVAHNETVRGDFGGPGWREAANSLPIVSVQRVYSSKSKNIHNTTATASEPPSIQNGVQMSAFKAMTFCKSDLTSLQIDCCSEQQNNVLVV
jgi:hypothetical protein